MKIFSTMAALALLIITTGCDPSYDDHHALEILSFSVISAPGARAANYGAAPITPYLDNGNFIIRWEVATEGAYQVGLYVSNDPRLDFQDPWNRDDIQFKQFYRVIGDSVNHELYLDTVAMNCQFTVDNVLACGKVSYENPGRDITPFLTQLPKPGYFILRACDAIQDCVTAALNVEFH